MSPETMRYPEITYRDYITVGVVLVIVGIVWAILW